MTRSQRIPRVDSILYDCVLTFRGALSLKAQLNHGSKLRYPSTVPQVRYKSATPLHAMRTLRIWEVSIVLTDRRLSYMHDDVVLWLVLL